MTARPVKTYFPQTRLSEIAASGGGIARDDAIAGALESIESMRTQGDAEITRAMMTIESVLAAAMPRGLSGPDMQKILLNADLVITLAGTFGYASLDKVMRSMCDVTDGLFQSGQYDIAPILVHAQSMRLMAPGTTTLSPEETVKVLAELAKILKHYNFGSLANQDTGE
jgi:hypothetical protein